MSVKKFYKVTCPHCENEVELEQQYGVFTCPKCGKEFEIISDAELQIETRKEQQTLKTDILTTIKESLKKLDYAKKIEESKTQEWKSLNDALNGLISERAKKLDVEIAKCQTLQKTLLTEIERLQKLEIELETRILFYNQAIEKQNKDAIERNRMMR